MNSHQIPRYIYYWTPVLVYLLAIYYLSSLPGSQLQLSQNYWIEFGSKSLLHFIEYAGLTLLIWRAQRNTYHLTSTTIFIIVIIYALSDEYHQSFTPFRQASLHDIVMDMLGSFTALQLVTRYRLSLPQSVQRLLAILKI